MANPFPANLADLQTLSSDHLNDPSNTRYSLTEINQHLDIAQDRWNREAHICRMTDTLTTVTNQYLYPLSSFTVTPLEILRLTHKGIDLVKRSKNYMDLYSSIDWTTQTGTPQEYMIDLNASSPNLVLHPTPQGNDAGANLVVEYVARHTPMVNSTDTPFTCNGVANTLILPYAAGLAIEVAADILEHDPTPETVKKAAYFRQDANQILSQVIQFYDRLDAEEPLRMQGGRNWRY